MTWLLRQLGITDDFVNHIDEVSLRFQYENVLFAGLALLLPVAVLIYLRQRRNLPTMPPALCLTLTVTRTLILLLLIIALADPKLVFDERKEIRPVVAVLFDHSHSMTLPAGPFESENELLPIAEAAGYRVTGSALDAPSRQAMNRMTRGKLAHAAVQNAGPLLRDLNKRFDVRYYGFARDITRLGVDPTSLKLPEPPSPGGPVTDTGNALHQVLEETSGQQLAGIVVLSDGQNTGGRSPAEAARRAASIKVPVFTVPVGSAKRLQDIAIVDLYTTEVISVGDTAHVSVTIESNGFDGRPVKVELKEEDKVIESKDLVLRGVEQQHLDLSFKATKPGVRYLTVHVPPQPEEPEYLHANNTETVAIRVTEERLKVLFVEGLPRWDFRFLKNALNRDNGIGGLAGPQPDIVLEAEWRRKAVAERVAALPRKLDQLAQYHTIVLGDASPMVLDAAFVELLDKAVREKGVGLIVAAGPLAMPHDKGFGERLRKLLPVEMQPGVPGLTPRGGPSFRLELAPEGSLHEATRLQDEPGRNQNTWRSLPPFFWTAAVEKAAPAATVLVYNSAAGPKGKLPLIAEHFAGQGKVLFVGTDETWRWRQNVGDRFFYRFWGQAVRAVARRDPKQSKKSWFDLQPFRVQPGEPVQVELRAFTPEGAPLGADGLVIQVQSPSENTTLEMNADPALKGRFTGRLTPKVAGTYKLTWAGGQGEPVQASLRVEPAPVEMRYPNVDRASLQRLAIAAGGEMLELPELGTLSEKLKGEPRFSEVPRETTLWDNWLMLGLLIFLYSIDVGLRRLMGLT